MRKGHRLPACSCCDGDGKIVSLVGVDEEVALTYPQDDRIQ